jgi:2-haloacid dehalogenase
VSTPATVNTVVFDFGGVLIDWNPRHMYRKLFNGDNAGMEAFLSTVCTPEWNEHQDAGRSIAEAEAEAIARHPDKAELIRAFYSRFDEMMADSIPGTVAILEALHERQVPLYGLTNWSAETFPHALKRFPFFQRFRGIVVSGRIKMKKPDPRIFAHLVSTHGLKAAETVFIDDSPKNVEAARAAGLQALHFTTPERLSADLRQLGVL